MYSRDQYLEAKFVLKISCRGVLCGQENMCFLVLERVVSANSSAAKSVNFWTASWHFLLRVFAAANRETEDDDGVVPVEVVVDEDGIGKDEIDAVPLDDVGEADWMASNSLATWTSFSVSLDSGWLANVRIQR